jgi:dimethylargininase
MMRRALTRAVSPAISACELTHLSRTPIDVARAIEQHRAYENALVQTGCELITVTPAPEAPDSVFVEDTAVVVEGLAVLTRPGARTRRTETDAVASVLEKFLTVVRLEAPATLDGGDVLRMGKVLFVGRTGRSNAEGRRQLAAAVAPRGFRVQEVDVRDALHLKSAVTAVADDVVVLQPRWIDPAVFADYRIIEVDEREPSAANVLRIDGQLIVPEAHPRTAARCAPFVDRILEVRVDELARAEGAVTCCSILIETEA